MEKKRLIVGITGASGAILGIELLKTLRKMEQVETHLVISRSAKYTIASETSLSVDQVYALADVRYDESNIGAAIASGSFHTAGMIVIPCSMKTLAGIACGYSDNLVLRAADVVLKEGRKLVLAVREMPFSRIHLRNMLTLSEMGAVILPPVLTFYSGANTIEDLIRHMVGKALDQFQLNDCEFRRWEGADCGLSSF